MVALGLAFAFGASGAGAMEMPDGARLISETIENQGLTREYHIYLPSTMKPGAPLVFVLHGYKGDASKLKPSRFIELAEEFGYAVCYPQGSKDCKGKNCWNVGYPWQLGIGANGASCEPMAVDDCKFICDLASHLSRRFKLSRKNVFLTGMSNGGEMCYLMAYRYPRKFAAIASMAGLTLVDMTEKYTYKHPVPFMEVHGTEDHTSYWTGDLENKYGWGAYLPVPDAVAALCKVNGCDMVEDGEVINEEGVHQVFCHYYSQSNSHTQGHAGKHGFGSATRPYPVVLYEVVGGGHNWAQDSFDSCYCIMSFFRENLR